MRKKFLLTMLTLLFVAMGSSGKLFADETNPVAKVGNTEYATINEAIAAWTHNTTLTLLADVTLTDVVTLKSTEHHTLDLGTYTMTAASGNNAIEITCQGLSSATYAITVNADDNNPGGITATGKACIYYSKSGSTKDRPIIRIYNGVFNGSYSINSKSNGNTNCPQIWIYGGTFNGNVNLTKNMLQVYGGTFNGWINCTGDQNAYRLIAGGRFKSWQFMTNDNKNGNYDKFGIATSKENYLNGNYNVGVYIDKEGYLVVGGSVITELCSDYKACVSYDNFKTTNQYNNFYYYLAQSAAAKYGLFYEDAAMAIAKHGEANVEVYVPAVQINGEGYETLADALDAASSMTEEVTININSRVTLNSPLNGSYSSIKFVGPQTRNSATAEIYLDVQGYIEAPGKKVAFENLTLSKSEGGFINNAGFMNVAFGVYNVNEVTYTNCTFANGSYASSGTVTYTGCTFKRSHDKYGLWAYGNADITVDGCTFADYRGIKMYAENGANENTEKPNLTVKNTNFLVVDNKPAIVLTYGESVTLENNTYSSTGVFELDLDGAPNGVEVTSDVAPTCINDNGACGVLVDGKIYTTVAQAAEVATSGSTVTLLHDSAETVELPYGVELDKNGFDANGVTVAPSVAKSYKANGELVAEYGDFESAIAAATINAEISRIEVLDNYEQKSVTNTANYYDVTQALTIGVEEDENYTVKGCSFAVRVQNAATLTIEEGLTIEGLDVVANGFATQGENMTINGTLKALSLKQWTSNGTIKVNGKVELGYGDGQFDMAYGNGNVIVNGNGNKTEAQFKAGYSGTRGNGGVLTLNDTYFEAGARFTVAGSNTIINVNNSLLKVSGGDAAGSLTLGETNVININLGSTIQSSTISGNGTINIDATGITENVTIIKGNMSGFAGTINVTTNNAVYEKTEEGLVVRSTASVKESGTWGGIDWTLTYGGTLTIAPTAGEPALDPNAPTKRVYEVGEWREAVVYNSNGGASAIGGYPYDVKAVKKLIIEEGVTKIGSFTAQFPNLTGEVVIPSTVTYIGQEAFHKAPMTSLVFAAGGTDYLCIANGAFKKTLIEEVSFPGDREYIHIHHWAFGGSPNLTKAFIPANLTKSWGGEHVDYFDNFNSQTNPSWTQSGSIFTGCTKMETITFENKEVRDLFFANGRQSTAEDYIVAAADLVAYNTFDEALAEIKNGGDLLLVKDCALTESLTIPADWTFAINLNGRTLSQSKTCTASYSMINNKGNLNIVGSGKISFKDTGAGDPNFGWGSYTVCNEGNLVVEKATIEHLGAQAFATHCIMAIYQYSGSTTINGGTISTPNYRSARLWKGDMTINGGKFEGQLWVQAVDNTANLVINGGEFTPRGNDGSSVFVTNSDHDVQLAVAGGKFATKIGCSDASKLAGAIKGGKFSATAKENTASELIATGYVFGEADADGYFSVVDDPTTHYIKNLAELKAFRDEVNSGNTYAGVTVYLGADIDLEQDNWTPINKFNGTFDGQNHTISNLWVTGSGNCGFFKQVADQTEHVTGTVKNVTFENATIISQSGNGTAGIIANAPLGARIKNVNLTGEVTIKGYRGVGGIVGAGFPVIEECTVEAEGTITATYWGAGGILGFASDKGAKAIKSTVKGIGEGLTIHGEYGGVGSVTGTPYGAAVDGATINDVNITSKSDYCMAYVDASGEVKNANVDNVVVKVNGNEIVGCDAVATIGTKPYFTFADAVAAADNNATISLIWKEGKAPIAMNASLYGKNVTITGTAKVDWSKGWLFVGRGGEGNATLTFDEAYLTSASDNSTYGIHVSGREKNTTNKYDGTVVIKNSTIELDYLINRGTMTLDENATLTVKNGFGIAGRPASETESGANATATLTLNDNSKVVVNNHNGMGLGQAAKVLEGLGVMNINSGSTFECTQDFLVTAKGTMNVNGGVVTTDVKITNNGVINVSGESTLNIASLEGEEINFLDGAIIKNSTIGGNVFVAGNVTFRGANTFAMLYDYGTLTDNYGTTAPMKWTVEEGASVTLTTAARYGLGYGDDVTVYGNIEDALTARENLKEADRSLFMHGLVAQESKGWNCSSALNIENAYVVIGSNNSFGNKPGNYGGTYTFNINNSVVDASRITFYEALSTTTFTIEGSDVKMGTFMTRDADSEFILKNSKVLSTTTTNGTDEGNYNAGKLTLVNSSLTYSATLSNTGVITVDATSTLTAPAISGAGTITIDAAKFVIGGGEKLVVAADMSGYTGTISLVNDDYVVYETTEDGILIKEKSLDGDGSAENPYELETLTELELFRNKVNAGDNYAGKYVKLTADVNLSATRSANNWEPIGTTACPFEGTFDGDGNTISNLVVEGGSYVGLFGKTVGATINNVTIKNANVRGTSYVGAIVGMGHTGTINNCHVIGNVQIEGNYMVGGISGQGYAIIYNSSVIATANSGSYVKGVHSADNLEGDNAGGIVGHCGENNTLTANTVKNITVSGTRKVGGIVGIANMGTNIDACVVENVTIETTATEEYANNNIKTMSIGALIGQYQNNGSNGTVTNSIVKTVTFNNVNDVTVDVGPITGGTRGTTVVIEPTGVTASNNDIYMSTIKDSNNSYLMNAVAEIEGVKYYSLQEAINEVGDGETITLLSDVNVTTPAYGQNALNYSRAINSTIDLNGKTLSANKGNSVFRFNITDSGATSDVTVKMMNGTVVAGDDTWCAVMAAGISADVKAIFNLEDITINGSKAGDLAVKSWDNAVVNANNVTIETTNGAGGFYAVGGEIVLNNCTVNQKGLHTAPYLSMAFAVSTEGKMTINSGTYSSEPTAASEGYNQGTSHGSWVGGVMNSGGTLIINGGTFSNDNYGDNSLATAARGLIFADTKGIVEVNGGTFNALKSIFDFQNNLGGTSPVITVKGGEYNADPRVVTSYGSIVIPEDYEVKNPTNGTWVVKQVSGTQTREFASAGWYWFSTYINLEGADGLKDLQDALVDENGDCVGKQIKGKDGFTQYFSGYNAWSPGLPAITTAEMYMVNVSAPVTVELTGKFVDYENRNITLNPGWNWIGYPVRETVAIENAFAAPFTPSDGDIIKAKSGGVSQYYKVAGGWFPSFDLVPGHGYKYLSVNPTTTGFCYTTENNSRGIANDNVIAENRWTPAASEFAENMVVIAMLNINGELADENYEVAAFANGVCRGSARPIYNEKLGKHILFMTINGEEVEELTFKCYDVNNGTEYELSNRVNYSNDAILGSIDEPYMFNMNFLNIEESSLDMINIYPNPTTTDRAINLQATCDNVEVFNALGVKVAEYQNVDTIDALETAGVYVIRVTINGETRNCRLVVK